MRSELRLSLALALLLSIGASAQDNYVEARIKLVSTTKPLFGIGIVHGKKTEPLVIPTDMFSDEVVYRGPARFELYQLIVSAKPAEPKTASDETKGKDKGAPQPPSRGVKAREPAHVYSPAGKPPLAWVDLPTKQGRLQLILLVTPGKDNGITVLSDVPGSFPPGSNRYLNLCAFPLMITTPSGQNEVPAGSSKTFRPGGKDNDFYDLQIHSHLSNEEQLAFSGRVYHMESVRKLYLMMPVPGNPGRVVVRDIEDRPTPAKGQTLTPTAPKGVK